MMIRWTGLAPWVFESPFPGSLTSTFLGRGERLRRAKEERNRGQEREDHIPVGMLAAVTESARSEGGGAREACEKGRFAGAQ